MIKINRKRAKLIIKILIFFLSLCILSKLISFTLSKYESLAISDPNIDVAFYLLDKDFQSMTLNLDNFFPGNTMHVYSFSIGNTDGLNIAQTDLEYTLKIRTTTNLPITYELYMNENYNTVGATNIITINSVTPDGDGTYFRNIETNTIQLLYTTPTTNNYQLVLYFPSTYNSKNYQDIIEAIEISVESRQII